MVITNTIRLTEKQEDEVRLNVTSKFESLFTDDFWHFSFEGTRLNLDTQNFECVFEIHSEKGSFNGLVQINERKQTLKSTIKFLELE